MAVDSKGTMVAVVFSVPAAPVRETSRPWAVGMEG